MVRPAKKSVSERLLEKYVVLDNGCWQWQGAVSSHYGTIKASQTLDGGRRTLLVHRLSYEIHKGPIPEGLQIDHLCHNKLCINVEHLEAVTSQVNCMRKLNKDNQYVNRAHCSQGHEYSWDNTSYTKSGSRVCLSCQRARQTGYRNNNRKAYNDYIREWRRKKRESQQIS